ncbi:MAG TPA: response regulator transcription factor [Methylomirabilota bacterium]|nr:response regulator transcription factor [Methylomirabilota bacterium]
MSRPRPAPLTVVVVDDELDFRLIVRALLRGLADSVTIVGEAQDGEEALRLLRRTRPDILICDIMIPGINGVEVARRVRDELPQTKTILMSSHVEDAYRLMASDSGAAVFINKHVITTSLVPAVRDLISRSGGGGSSLPSNGGTSSAAPPQ